MDWDSSDQIFARKLLAECGNEVIVVDSLTPEYGGNLRNLQDFHDKIKINLSDIRDTNSHKRAYKRTGLHFQSSWSDKPLRLNEKSIYRS